MNDEHITPMVSNWKHWLIYTTLTFISIFVFAEFVLSISLYSLIAPSSFMFYFTPVGLFFGESMVSFFASALLFVGLFLILRLSVYVKKENSLKFNRSNAYKLLPFYLTAIISLAIYISMIPLELSNIVTYLVFVLLFESFVEHSQVSGYGQWLSELIKKPAVEKIPEEEITEIDRKTDEITSVTEEVPDDEMTDVDRKIQDLISLTEEVPEKEKIDEVEIPAAEEVDEDIVKTPVVVKKRVKKVIEPAEEDLIKCPACGFEGTAETDECPECGEPLGDELLDTFEKHEVKFDKERSSVEDEPVKGKIEKELDEEMIHLEEDLIKCPACGFEGTAETDECPECGGPLGDELLDIFEKHEVKFDKERLSAEDKPVEGGIEKELDDELIHLEEDFIKCPACGFEGAAETNECPDCGESLEDELLDIFGKHEGKFDKSSAEDKPVEGGIEKELNEELIHLEEELEECPICGTKLQEGAESCPKCDPLIYEIDEASEELLDELSVELKLDDLKDIIEEKTDTAEEIVSDRCPLCLADITDDAVKCPECGEPLIEEEEEEKDDFFKDIE